MIQGGDPTGQGSGGDSFYGGFFKDEFSAKLLHQGRGILSMANKGKVLFLHRTLGHKYFSIFYHIPILPSLGWKAYCFW